MFMFRHAQQMKQGWESRIQIEKLAAAGDFDAVALAIRAHHAWLRVDSELLEQRQLLGIELRSKRLQNWAEVLINHRREVRLVVAGQQRAERGGTSQRRAVRVRFDGCDQQSPRRRDDEVAVRERVVILRRKTGS